MRELAKSGALTVFVADQPDPNGGGACHSYQVRDRDGNIWLNLDFQKGPLKENGANGVTDVLLAEILRDRLEHFQAGPFPSTHSAWGLSGINTYLESQKARTADREQRGVEGVDKP